MSNGKVEKPILLPHGEFQALIDLHHQAIRSACEKALKRTPDAEDAYAVVMDRIWRRCQAGHIPELPYILTITRNACRDILEERKKFGTRHTRIGDDQADLDRGQAKGPQSPRRLGQVRDDDDDENQGVPESPDVVANASAIRKLAKRLVACLDRSLKKAVVHEITRGRSGYAESGDTKGRATFDLFKRTFDEYTKRRIGSDVHDALTHAMISQVSYIRIQVDPLALMRLEPFRRKAFALWVMGFKTARIAVLTGERSVDVTRYLRETKKALTNGAS